MSAPKDKRKQPHRIADRMVDPFTAMLSLCGDDARVMLQELMMATYRMGVDYCNSLNEGKTITLSEASRISGISEYLIKQAIEHRELSSKKTGTSKNSPIYINLVEFNLWRNINGI